MTSSKLMAEVLRKLPNGPTPILDLCLILKRTEANVRRVLGDMEELGLVERVEISIPGRTCRDFDPWSKSEVWMEEIRQYRKSPCLDDATK